MFVSDFGLATETFFGHAFGKKIQFFPELLHFFFQIWWLSVAQLAGVSGWAGWLDWRKEEEGGKRRRKEEKGGGGRRRKEGARRKWPRFVCQCLVVQACALKGSGAWPFSVMFAKRKPKQSPATNSAWRENRDKIRGPSVTVFGHAQGRIFHTLLVFCMRSIEATITALSR